MEKSKQYSIQMVKQIIYDYPMIWKKKKENSYYCISETHGSEVQ